MDLVVESILYIKTNNAASLYYGEGDVYVVPKTPVRYINLFEGVSKSFDAFCIHAASFRRVPMENTFMTASQYFELCIANAAPEDFIRGFNKIQQLIKEDAPCRAIERINSFEKRKIELSLHEGEAERIFLESSMYMNVPARANFYQTPYNVAKHYASKRIFVIARRMAKEALSVAARTSSSAGVDKCRLILQAAEEACPVTAFNDLLASAAERMNLE